MRWPRVSFGANAERRLETLAVFSMSIYFIIPVSLMCWGSTLALLFFAFPFMLAYLVWIFFLDKSPVTGSRTAWLRGSGENGNWWRRYADFFPITLVKTAPLPADRPYIFGYHPHGIISVGAFACFATNGVRTVDLSTDQDTSQEGTKSRRGFSSLFPDVRVRLLTLAINFMIPFLREYLLWLGCANASRETFTNCLKSPGDAVCVVVGGAEESTLVREHGMDLVLEKRKGFVREAIKAGASLVPTLAFGENDLYSVTHLPPEHLFARFQDLFKRKTGVAIPIFNGRSIWFQDFGLMPRRTPIIVVVGAPIAPPTLTLDQHSGQPLPFNPRFDSSGKALNPDAEMVEELHRRYVDGLVQLYQAHKDKPWNLPGLQRSVSMRLVE
eukprot:gb/GEZN01008415.1/.p1 GENE.gb/GEZN01008415.1/~~gb/GEZN01008415.1/.p1  ORF type:complete len:384 (+),score=36.79 gb/GEZN01008415.1/:37-1188(+)